MISKIPLLICYTDDLMNTLKKILPMLCSALYSSVSNFLPKRSKLITTDTMYQFLFGIFNMNYLLTYQFYAVWLLSNNSFVSFFIGNKFALVVDCGQSAEKVIRVLFHIQTKIVKKKKFLSPDDSCHFYKLSDWYRLLVMTEGILCYLKSHLRKLFLEHQVNERHSANPYLSLKSPDNTFSLACVWRMASEELQFVS